MLLEVLQKVLQELLPNMIPEMTVQVPLKELPLEVLQVLPLYVIQKVMTLALTVQRIFFQKREKFHWTQMRQRAL